MAKQYTQVLGDVFNTPWAIMPGKLESICGVLESRLAGGHSFSAAELEQMALANKPPEHATGSSIAVLPLWGTIHHHAGIVQQASGGTCDVQFGRQFKEAMANNEVGTIVIHAKTPGGSVHGAQETSDLIFNHRGTKPIITIVDAQCASKGYWIGTAADEMYVTPSGEVGSIGVVMAHRDISKAEEQEGRKTTLIAIPENKVAGNPYEPLSDETVAEIKADSKVYYDSFVESVARNRGATTTTVHETFGRGGMVLAQKAAALGMVDGIKTFDQVIADIQSNHSGSRRTSASRRRELQLAQAENQA